MKRWEAWINHLGWGLTAASGLLYGVLKYFLTGHDPDSRLSHPWQPTVLAIHILVAPVAVFGFGLLFRQHALARLTRASGWRLIGAGITLLAIPLAFSGYLLQALTGDAARRWAGWAHAGLGLIYAIGYALHPVASRLPDDATEAPAKAKDNVV